VVEPATYVVPVGIASVKVDRVAGAFPLLVVVIVYSKVSPGEIVAPPLPATLATVLVEAKLGVGNEQLAKSVKPVVAPIKVVPPVFVLIL